jgi:hypothetical protein
VASGGCEASVGGTAFDAKEPTLFSRAVFKFWAHFLVSKFKFSIFCAEFPYDARMLVMIVYWICPENYEICGVFGRKSDSACGNTLISFVS